MDYRKIIKEIGRGKNHARDLDRDTARGLYAHMLNGEVPDLELGGVLIAPDLLKLVDTASPVTTARVNRPT